MSQGSPDYKALYLKEQHKRQAAETARDQEQRRQRAQLKGGERTRKTTLSELLDACHVHLYSNLAVQTDLTLSTRGDPANANNKFRPERLRKWDDFPARQSAIWDELMSSDFASERHFNSVHTLEEMGETVRERMMSSELDLHLYERITVEDHISAIVKQLYTNRRLRRKFRLQGAVKFENHANTLSPETQLEEGMQQMTVARGRRRSPRFQAQADHAAEAEPQEVGSARAGGSAEPARLSRPRADQFCVYNTPSTTQNTAHRVPAFVIDYKAPHKLRLGHIYEGLGDIDLENVVQMHDLETQRDHSHWRARAAAQLNNWQVVYEDLLDDLPKQDAPSSEYRPPRDDIFLRMSPVQLRQRPARASPACRQPEHRHEESDDEIDPDSPSRRPPARESSHRSARGHGRDSSSNTARRQRSPYCTQDCLRGLVAGGPLDKSCPNVKSHGGSHQIDRTTFLTLIREQLAGSLDTDCTCLRIHGARGVLFKIRLTAYGYTVAAKGTPRHFVRHLRHEAAIYDRLRPVQGIYVPVCLGSIDLQRPYMYDGIANLVHMLFLGFGGELISQHVNEGNVAHVIDMIDRSTRAFHQSGVLHRDLFPRNMLWYQERVMMIDFERAEVVEARVVLGAISSNRKRKRGLLTGNKQQIKGMSVFERESIQGAIIELHEIVARSSR
ncbi:hypothetical protein IQ07DRAFT_637603 [Pyrenochaeta sp. DS3sAY3a]|nr:hypothetical protein IQ07DRAFT_637603 [Pyrenochaeta sp. DS3sAY3a]